MNTNALRLFIDATRLFINEHSLFIDAMKLFNNARILIFDARTMVANARLLFIYAMILAIKALVLRATGVIMRNKTIRNTLLLLCLAACAFAGWERTYGGSDFDYGSAVVQTSDGGYIIAGRTESFGAGSYDVYLVKTDGDGDTLWTRTYGGSEYECGYSVAQTTDGGYIVVGRTYSFVTFSYEVYILKLTSLGDSVWTRRYGGNDDDRGYSVAQTTDGGYIVAGRTNSYGAGSYDVYVLKLNSSGDSVWTRTYGGSFNDRGHSVAQTFDGGYIVTGVTRSFGAHSDDIYVLKLSSSGDTVWTRTYGGSDWDVGQSVVQTSDGGYIIAGHTYSFGVGLADIYLVKTDAEGDTVWTRTYGGTDWDEGYSVAQTSDGGFIIAGTTSSFGDILGDVYVVKTDALGDTIWTRTYGGSDYDYGYSVAQTSDGGYIIAGGTYSFGAGSYDVYLIKTDSLGYTAIGESPSARPEDIAISAYPNPFNSAVVISVETQDFASLQIEVFDINGRIVANIPVGTRHVVSLRNHAVIWQPDESLGSGIYLVRLKNIETGRSLPRAATKIIYLK